jgi:NADH:ubiquinone oxidoreductase subunit 4 (subunit M)
MNQPDAAISQVYYLSFMYSSTCFGRPHTHHQELQQLQQQPLVYRRILVIAVLLVVVGPAGLTMTNSTAITKLRR